MLVVTCIGYAGITTLLLTSTGNDPFYGMFYVPVLVLLIILTIAAGRGWRLVRLIAAVTSSLQCCLAAWLIALHGLHTPAWFLAVLPTIVILAAAAICSQVASGLKTSQ